MNCTELQECLGAYLEDILDVNEVSACRQHLDTCAACRAIAESSIRLRKRLLKRGPMATGGSLVGPVMERIRQREMEEPNQEAERETFMNRLLKWRWSFGMGAMASAAVLILFVILATPKVQVAGAEIITRGANAMAKLRSIHLLGQLRTAPADNFSGIAPEQDFVKIELWKEFEPVLKWRVEKPGRIAVMDGQETMLFIRPDHAVKFSKPSKSAFDTQWLHEIANLSQALSDELRATKKNGWATTVTQEKGNDGQMKSVVTIEAKSGYANDDYLKNTFFCTADTRRVYVFDEANGTLSSAKIFLHETGGDKLLFELTQIEGNVALASDVFQLPLPPDVSWAEEMQVLPDNEKYAAMESEQAAKSFFDACSREDWNEAAKFITITGSLKKYLGSVQVISLGTHFTSAISLLNGAEFVPYEIKLKNGEVKKHNLALKKDPRTKRWFVDGGI